MTWRDIFALFAAPVAHVPVHDENVHRMRNAAQNAIAGVQIAARQSRRMAEQLQRPEHLSDKIEEAEKLTKEMLQIINGGRHDSDDGLLSGMDRVLKKDA